MDPRRQDETKTAASATSTTIAGTPAPATKRGTTTDGVKAGQLFEKLTQLDLDEQAELAASPADIRSKFERRRANALEGASEAVKVLVGRMRAST